MSPDDKPKPRSSRIDQGFTPPSIRYPLTIAQQMSAFEQVIHEALDNFHDRPVLLGFVQSLYIEKYGEKLDPKMHGFRTLVQLAQSFASIDTAQERGRTYISREGIGHTASRKDSESSSSPLIKQRILQPMRPDAAVDPATPVHYFDQEELLVQTLDAEEIFSNPEAKGFCAVAVGKDSDVLCLVQISTQADTYVFDVEALGCQRIFDALRVLLENQGVTKLMHGLHTEAETFTGRGGISIRGVLDGQLVVEFLDSVLHAGFSQTISRFGQQREHGGRKRGVSHGARLKKRNGVENEPSHTQAIRCTALDTQLLVSSYAAMERELGSRLKDFIAASGERASFGATNAHWRSVAFDVDDGYRISSSELFDGRLKKIDSMLLPEPLTVHNEMLSLLEILPLDLAAEVASLRHVDAVTEIALDLGSQPYAWKDQHRLNLTQNERTVTAEDIESIMKRLGTVGSDNRVGVEGKLHRISVMRSRENSVVGVSLRVGRYVTGNSFLFSDILRSNANILFIGAPGSRKTTVVREIARVLSETKNVIIVDTSSEIAGAGNTKHVSVGKARRMFVERLEKQSGVMIECVKNHRPDVMLIDEIGRKNEARSARTAASRGVRLIATAHGSFRSLLSDPDTNGLLGGIQSVVMGDKCAKENAKAGGRGKEFSFRKSRAERLSKPVFDVAVELSVGGASAECTVIWNTAEAVDRIFEGKQYDVQRRKWDGVSPFFLLQLGCD